MSSPGQRGGLSRRELLRKSIHMATGLGAFAVGVLGPALSALLAAGLLVWNVAVWPRLGGRAVWRERDSERGVAIGIVLYPAVLLALILIFWRRLEIVAAVWAILGFGDGIATIAGRALGSRRLPWNAAKTWAGSLAFWLFGALGAGAALAWTLAVQGRETPPLLVTAAIVTALAAALAESWPSRLDDNLTVPLVSALSLWAFLG